MTEEQTPFTTVIAEGDWSACAKACADAMIDLPPLKDGESRLGIVYVSHHLADDLGSLVTFLRQRTPVAHWLGAVGSGVVVDGQELHDRPATAVLVGSFPQRSFRVLSGLTMNLAEIDADTRAWIEETSPAFGVVHGNPGVHGVIETVEMLALTAGGAMGGGFLVGGLAAVATPGAIDGDGSREGAVAGALFGPGVEVATALSQGCSPLGDTHMVTEAADNVVMSIDDRPALDVLKEDVGELLARDLARLSGYVHAALPVTGSDTGDYMVRNLLAIDQEHGWIGIGGEVDAGDRLLFVRRDPESAQKDFRRMLLGLKSRLPGPPRGGLYFSCVARGPSLFGEGGAEARMIQEILGPIPLIGFFGGGEISNARLYAYTGVLALFF